MDGGRRWVSASSTAQFGLCPCVTTMDGRGRSDGDGGGGWTSLWDV